MTSPVYFMTAAAIIAEAYQNACVISQGQSPNSEQFANGMNRLNRLINLKQTKGIKLWTNIDFPVTLVAGTNLYTFGPTGSVPMTKPLRAPMAYYSDVNGIRRPIDPISRQEWNTLSQVNQQGQINSYFVDKQQLSLNVYFWLTPDATAATGTVDLILQQQITNVVGIIDQLNFPIEWSGYLTWALSDQLTLGAPENVIARCKGEAEMMERILEGWDVEDAQTFFTPDPRGAYGGGTGF